MNNCPCCGDHRIQTFDEYVKCFGCGGRFMTLPNLDAMNAEELRKYWSKHNRTTLEKACELVGPRRDNVKVVETSAAYAIAKACAIDLRLEGKIAAAQIYENHCEMYYKALPEDVRW